MAETFANSAYSTLASGISAGDTSLSVAAGHGARFPATGDFRIRIDSEIMICTARSTDTLTVTRGAEGTVAASHTTGAAVNHVLTRGGLLALIADLSTVQIGQALGSSSSPTTTSTTFVDCPDLSVTMTTAGGVLVCLASISQAINAAGAGAYFALSLDGAAEVAERVWVEPISGYQDTLMTHHVFSGVAAGSHTVKARWKVSSNTLTAFGTDRGIIVVELKD